MVQINHFRKRYGSHIALHIDSLRLASGIHLVKGKNGAGKTTFFKTLAGLLPFQGEVILDSRLNLQTDPVACRRIVNIGEAEPVYPDFVTGYDLLQLYANSKRADTSQVAELADTLEIGSFYRRAIGTYSSGMAKKLSLALAFVGRPRLILLDEPLVTLDQATVRVVYDLIQTYHQQGVTFLISSHQALEDQRIILSSILSVSNQTVGIDEKATYPDQ